jgi:hypothetical protein
MKFVGIDPGAFGAVAILDKDSRELVIIDMPTLKVKRGPRVVNQVDAHMLADSLRPHVTGEIKALIEKSPRHAGPRCVLDVQLWQGCWYRRRCPCWPVCIF